MVNDLRTFGERYIASLPDEVRGQAWIRMNAALTRVNPTGADKGHKYLMNAIRCGIMDQRRDDRWMPVRQRGGKYADKWVSPCSLGGQNSAGEVRFIPPAFENRWPAHVPPRVRLAVKMRAEGHSFAECAIASGVSVSCLAYDFATYREALGKWATA